MVMTSFVVGLPGRAPQDGDVVKGSRQPNISGV
jgi:hypothetical protein